MELEDRLNPRSLMSDAGDGWYCSMQPDSKAAWMGFSPICDLMTLPEAQHKKCNIIRKDCFNKCSSLTAIKIAGKGKSQRTARKVCRSSGR